MTLQAPPYVMELSLNVLEHLGINLYSNVPSVLSEVVANAWDADAPWVKIDIEEDPYRIVIQDGGSGMTRDEVNKRFLTVGYRKRDHEPGLTPKGRAPMGRKGIGKLSLFSIADLITVETVKNGEKSAFRMNLNDIREAIKQEGNEDKKNRISPSYLTLQVLPGSKVPELPFKRFASDIPSVRLRLCASGWHGAFPSLERGLRLR